MGLARSRQEAGAGSPSRVQPAMTRRTQDHEVLEREGLASASKRDAVVHLEARRATA